MFSMKTDLCTFFKSSELVGGHIYRLIYPYLVNYTNLMGSCPYLPVRFFMCALYRDIMPNSIKCFIFLMFQGYYYINLPFSADLVFFPLPRGKLRTDFKLIYNNETVLNYFALKIMY